MADDGILCSIELVVQLAHYLEGLADAPKGMRKVMIMPGNLQRGVLYFLVWVQKTKNVSVPLGEYECKGKTVEELKQLLKEKLLTTTTAL